MELQVLDRYLNIIHIVDEFRSAIWMKRYYEIGDCELYVPATEDNLKIYRKNYFLARPDDDMVCVIKKIEIDTDPENGNYLIVTGYDTRCYADQRIIWGTAANNGRQEEFLRKLVSDSMIKPSDANRRIKKANGQSLLALGTLAGFKAASTEQVSYQAVGEKIRETCRTNEWGWRNKRGDGVLLFEIYAGKDKTGSVKFSATFDNLDANAYTDDITNLGNVALIGGEGEGSNRALETYGSSASIYRSEKFVDASNITKQVKYETLKQDFPGGAIVMQGGYCYRVPTLRIAVINEEHADWLLTMIDGASLVTIDGAVYVEASNVVIASVPNTNPKNTDTCTLTDVIYKTYLISKGAEELSQYGEVVTFDGSIVPDITFQYKRDYDLGDIVSVENEFGIRADARIVEMMESEDETGYHIEPTLEYINVYSVPDERETIMTEELIVITTETGDSLLTEGA